MVPDQGRDEASEPALAPASGSSRDRGLEERAVPAVFAVGPNQSAPPTVTLFDATTGAPAGQFLAYDKAFLGGVKVAQGGFAGEAGIVTGSAHGSSHVKLFDAATGAERLSFLA